MKETIGSEQVDFFERVYEVVRLIPHGRVTSYGSIAKFLGMPRSSRMVGWAMNAAHSRRDVPAHRVVNRNGLLTGKVHFNPPGIMEELLIKEGITVKDDQIQEFQDHFWDPEKELSL